jgi:hypothetical protein
VWLGSLGQGQARDAGVSAFTRRIATADPEAAAQWASSINDEGMRNSQLDAILGGWLKLNPTNASAWINNAPLPDEMKSRLLSQAR